MQAVPFENLDVLLGRGIRLDPVVVEQKLVGARRGGYCFEQNSLLLHVLTALGYETTPLSARVRLQRPREFMPPRTHVFVRVVLDAEPWLCDVGGGALSPTAPLRLDMAGDPSTPHEPRRLVREGDWATGDRRAPTARIFHQVNLGSEWQDVCEFTLEPMPEIDREADCDRDGRRDAPAIVITYLMTCQPWLRLRSALDAHFDFRYGIVATALRARPNSPFRTGLCCPMCPMAGLPTR